MCLIIASPWGESCPEEYLQAGWSHNDDGWGIMWHERESGIHVLKGMKYGSLLAAYKRIPADSPYAIHLRFGTSGGKDKVNCHPFPIGHGYQMMHNGILSIPHARQDRSDTWHYAALLALSHGTEEELVKSFPFVEKEIGKNNKFVIMSPKGDLEILNEKSGEWDGAIWYSNTYSLVPWEAVTAVGHVSACSVSSGSSASPIHPWAWAEEGPPEEEYLIEDGVIED